MKFSLVSGKLCCKLGKIIKKVAQQHGPSSSNLTVLIKITEAVND